MRVQFQKQRSWLPLAIMVRGLDLEAITSATFNASLSTSLVGTTRDTSPARSASSAPIDSLVSTKTIVLALPIARVRRCDRPIAGNTPSEARHEGSRCSVLSSSCSGETLRTYPLLRSRSLRGPLASAATQTIFESSVAVSTTRIPSSMPPCQTSTWAPGSLCQSSNLMNVICPALGVVGCYEMSW